MRTFIALGFAATVLAGRSYAGTAGDATFDLDATATTASDATRIASVGATVAGTAAHGDSTAAGQASLAVRAGTDGPGVSLTESASAHPYTFELFQFDFAETAALDVAPALSDRPDRWRRRYSSGELDFGAVCLQYLGDQLGLQLIRVELGFGELDQRDGATLATRATTSADLSPFSVTLRAHGTEVARLDPIALESHGISTPAGAAGDRSAVILEQFFPRITGIPLGLGRLDLAVGFASTGWEQLQVNDQTVSTITTQNLPALKTRAARARLTASLAGVDAQLTAERGMYLTTDAALVVENRATAQLATGIAGGRARLSGFAADSTIWTSPTTSARHPTGGVALGYDHALPDHWQLTSQAELARTFYASLDGTRAPEVDGALRIDLGLHRDLKNWLPR